MEIVRVTLIWFGFFILAFINGALREIALKKIFKEPLANHISAVTAIVLFTIYLYFIWDKTHLYNFRSASYTGIYWLLLTIFAETFIVGRLMAHQSFEQIFSNYNLMKGNLWPLVLLWVGLLPVLFLSIQMS